MVKGRVRVVKVEESNGVCLLPLQERLSEQLEEQRQEQALQRYHSEAEELDHWLLSTRATLNSALHPNAEDMDMEEQLIDCQVNTRLMMPTHIAVQ